MLTASRSGNRRLLLWLLPLFALWANIHIQCMVGLVFLGLAAIEPLAARVLPDGWVSLDARRLPLGWLLGIFVLSAAAMLVNPYHFRLYLAALELLGQTALWNRIAELLAMPFRTWSNWIVLAVALAATFALGRQRQIRPLLVLALAAAIYFGFRSQRDAWMVLVTGLAALASLKSGEWRVGSGERGVGSGERGVARTQIQGEGARSAGGVDRRGGLRRGHCVPSPAALVGEDCRRVSRAGGGVRCPATPRRPDV